MDRRSWCGKHRKWMLKLFGTGFFLGCFTGLEKRILWVVFFTLQGWEMVSRHYLFLAF